MRIIPALAGNTPSLISAPALRGDHPRSRGEYAPVMSGIPEASGSSPLSRGIRPLVPLYDEITGIIPALAGNTRAGQRMAPLPPDHPRSRGEYTLIWPTRH